MKKKNKIFQKLTSLLLSTVMIVGMMPTMVYAAPTDKDVTKTSVTVC